MINFFKKMVSFILSFTFLIGMFVFPSNFFLSISAAGESNVKTYAELDKDYDKFIYVGVDVIEVANGLLTDGYVQPGDWLEYRMTILSDMYIGASKPYMVYEKDFFDVRVISSTTPKGTDSYTNADYETNTKCQNGFMMGPDHTYSSANNSAIYHNLTSLPASKVSVAMGYCEVDAETYANWDLVVPNIAIKTAEWNSNLPMTEDEWFVGWYVRVKEGLADGTTGSSFSPETIWQHNINPATGKGDVRRLAQISSADTQGVAASSQVLSNRYNIVTMILEDTTHTFTIGTEEAPVKKKTVTFQTLDGTVLSSAEYTEGDTVEVPRIDGLVAWTENGKAVELGESFVMGQRALTYTAVLDTDKFNVSIDLMGGTYSDDAFLPEDTEIIDGKLVVKAGFGETVDLSTLPLPEKTGYTGAWNPATVTIDSTRGVSASVKWSVAVYKAKFYLDKEAYESGAVAVAERSFVYGNKIPFANIVVSKEDVKFAGWIDAATGEVANAETIYSDNMNFYADWTDYNASATISGLDYVTGEWVSLATKKADAGSIISINDIKALVTEENFGSSAVTYAFATLTSDRAGERVANDGYTMVEGANNIYIQTNVKFTYTLETPVFDEEGYITEEVILEEKTITTFKATQVVFVPALADKFGYKFTAWVDANGNEYAAGNISLDFAKGTDYTFTAKYELVEYTIEFVINKDATYKEKVTAVEKVKLGDTITFANLSYVDAEGNETGLPEIGVNNENQEYGPYDSLNGYKFKGWMAGIMASALVDYDITQEVTFTPTFLESVTYSEVITIKGEWEAVEYNINVYYSDMVSDNAELIYNRKIIYTAKTGSQLTDVYSAITEVVKHDFPEGFRFSSWRTDDGDFAPSYMPAYGLDLYAYYSPIQLSVYIDYNCSTPYNPVPAEKCIIKSDYSSYLFYHDDIENSIPEGMSMSVADLVRNSADLESMSPGEEYEFAGWQVCHVKNDDEIYKRDCWTLGVNDENTTIAKSTIIFQARWKLRKYKVTWVVDGTETKTEVIFGEKIPVPENPEKVGYTFVGWNPEVPETMPANNLEFTAAFTVNSYDLIFDANGGSWADGTTEKKASNGYESSITIPENPEKIGHTFDGWDIEIPETMPAQNVVAKAKWIKNNYKITWIVDGTETKTEVIFGEKIPVPENPEKVGYTFVGWNLEVPETMPANNLEFTAAFTVNSYDLIFDANGGSWADGTTEKKASNGYESSITIPENPEKIGHTFDGWDIEIPETMPAQNVVAKAKWIKNNYKITWIVDGTETKTEVIFGEKIPVPENPGKVGYTFVGWNPEVPETMPANNLEFTAAFRANSYDAVFNANGGLFFNGSSTKTNSVKYDSVIPTPETPVRMGYDFIGWSPEIGIMDSVYGKMFMSVWSARSDTRYVVETYKMNALGEYEKKSIQSLNGITDSTVYANYSIDDGFILNEEKSILNGIVAPEGSLVLKVYIDRKTYTFTTTVDGNSVSTDYLYGAVVTQPTNPAKTGYTFAGWSSEVPSVMPADNVTVEALWQVNSYKVTWIVNGKETVTNVNYGEKIVVPSDIIKGGYKFVGWDKEIPETMPADSMIFTAEFELSFRMSIRNPSTTTISYGDSIILHADMNEALPSGWTVKWTADNGNFSYSANGETCTITPSKSGDTTFTATVYDENGNEISKDTQTMKSKAGFFDKFIAFFKKLFGATKVIPQAFKGIF